MSKKLIKKAVFNETTATWTTDTDKTFKVGQVLTFDNVGPVWSALNHLRLSYEELLMERSLLQELLANTFMNFRVKHEKPPENYDDLNSQMAYQSLKLAAFTDRTGFYKSMAELEIFAELGYFIALSMKFTLEGDGLAVTVAPPREGELQHENIVSMGASVSEYVSEGAKFAAMITNLRPILKNISTSEVLCRTQEVDVERGVPAIHLPINNWPKLLGMLGWILASIDADKLPDVMPEIFNNVCAKDVDAVYILGLGVSGENEQMFLHVIPADAIDPNGSIDMNIKKLAYALSAITSDIYMNRFVLKSYAVFKTVEFKESRVPVAAIVTKTNVVTYSQNQINGMHEPDSDVSKSAFDLAVYQPLTDCIENA